MTQKKSNLKSAECKYNNGPEPTSNLRFTFDFKKYRSPVKQYGLPAIVCCDKLQMPLICNTIEYFNWQSYS